VLLGFNVRLERAMRPHVVRFKHRTDAEGRAP
jgi:hypothetical protein